MVAIKLRRIGKKGQAAFRVVVSESRSKVTGKFIEDLGWVNPHANKFEINTDRAAYWIKNGAQPTNTVRAFLNKANLKK